MSSSYFDSRALAYLMRLREEQKKKFEVSTTRELLDNMGSPDDKLKIIHVAGTNGKGSICAYITGILLAAGKTVGTFTSPFVYDYDEQFCINGVPSFSLCDKFLNRAVDAAREMVRRPSAFETETCTAFGMFAHAGCEYAVVECGLGGLKDATNAINKKILAVIGSISLEHTNVLGHSLSEIAVQKAGIIKDCPAVANALQADPGIVDYLVRKGAVIAGVPEIIKDDVDGCLFRLDGTEYTIKMHGKEQAYNAATAIKACSVLGFDSDAIKKGIENVTMPGRIEIINSDKIYILDGSHNPASFNPLIEFIQNNYAGRKINIVYGCLNDKDVYSCLKNLSRLDCSRIFAVTPDNYRAREAAEILPLCEQFFPAAEVKESIADAMEAADGGLTLVCGSFTLLKEAREWIGLRR